MGVIIFRKPAQREKIRQEIHVNVHLRLHGVIFLEMQRAVLHRVRQRRFAFIGCNAVGQITAIVIGRHNFQIQIIQRKIQCLHAGYFLFVQHGERIAVGFAGVAAQGVDVRSLYILLSAGEHTGGSQHRADRTAQHTGNQSSFQPSFHALSSPFLRNPAGELGKQHLTPFAQIHTEHNGENADADGQKAASGNQTAAGQRIGNREQTADN